MLRLLTRRRGASARLAPRLEVLEDRLVLSPFPPGQLDAAGEYMLTLINRARANPAGTAANFGIDLNEGLAPGTIPGTPKQPWRQTPPC
jgi:hypothetical protein